MNRSELSFSLYSMITKKMRIPFQLCDAARIMFFGSFFEIYHMFLEEALPQMGIEWKNWFMNETGAPVRGLTTQYNKPLAFGEEYTAKLSVKNIGNSSVTFLFEMGTEKDVHASAEITHTFVHFKERVKATVPEHIKQALEKHLIPR